MCEGARGRRRKLSLVAARKSSRGSGLILSRYSGAWNREFYLVKSVARVAEAATISFFSFFLATFSSPTILPFTSDEFTTISLPPLSDASIYFRPGEFWHRLNAGHSGGYPVAAAICLVFDTLHGGMAAHPFRRFAGNLFGQDHYDVHRTTLADSGRALEKDARLTEVECLGVDAAAIGVHFSGDFQALSGRASLIRLRRTHSYLLWLVCSSLERLPKDTTLCFGCTPNFRPMQHLGESGSSRWPWQNHLTFAGLNIYT